MGDDDVPAGWRESVNINLTATFLTLKAFLAGMKDRHRGSIITMSFHLHPGLLVVGPYVSSVTAGAHVNDAGAGRGNRRRS